MLESLSCPSCFTHYGLRPERVHVGVRRARCFRCGEVFGVEEAIQHLLFPDSDPGLAGVSPTATLEGIKPEDLLELDGVLSAPPPPVPIEMPPMDSALTLGDLEGSEEEMLEKTLIIEADSPEGEASDSLTSDEGGGFASAKDAIAKLLGNTAPPTSSERRSTGRTSSMDVEATLDALETTLGGTPTRDLSGRPAITGQDHPAKQTMGSTIRLSPTELQAAMAAGAPSGPPPSQAPTVAIPAMPSPRPAIALQPQGHPPAETSPVAATGDSNLLKIQVGQETFQNVTLDQLTAWIEQGRVQDWHPVARQFSDNWIEAGKVPSLRPVFERVRRMSQSAPSPQDAPAVFDTAPVKKGLFGWMSNRS